MQLVHEPRQLREQIIQRLAKRQHQLAQFAIHRSLAPIAHGRKLQLPRPPRLPPPDIQRAWLLLFVTAANSVQYARPIQWKTAPQGRFRAHGLPTGHTPKSSIALNARLAIAHHHKQRGRRLLEQRMV